MVGASRTNRIRRSTAAVLATSVLVSCTGELASRGVTPTVTVAEPSVSSTPVVSLDPAAIGGATCDFAAAAISLVSSMGSLSSSSIEIPESTFQSWIGRMEAAHSGLMEARAQLEPFAKMVSEGLRVGFRRLTREAEIDIEVAAQMTLVDPSRAFTDTQAAVDDFIAAAERSDAPCPEQLETLGTLASSID